MSSALAQGVLIFRMFPWDLGSDKVGDGFNEGNTNEVMRVTWECDDKEKTLK